MKVNSASSNLRYIQLLDGTEESPYKLMFHLGLPYLRLEQKELFFVFSLACLSGHGQRAYAGAQDLRTCLDNMDI
jgi:hypothetical protein